MVLRTYSFFVLPLKGEMQKEKDTESVFFIAPDGFAHTRFFCEGGFCTAKECYEYKEGQLVRRKHFATLDRHSVFTRPQGHSHRLLYEDEWIYAGGKVVIERHKVGEERILTREIRYSYDAQGRVDEIYYQYPPQTLEYYPAKYQVMQYRYCGDTICKLGYRAGKVCDSSYALERYDGKGLRTETLQFSADRRRFERVLNKYDTSGRIVVCDATSDRPAVQADGVVLRADRVEYTYDEQARPDEVRFFARGIKRWSYKYIYLK